MNKITITIDNQEVIVTYTPLFRHLIEVEFIKPYSGLKVECGTDRENCNLFDPSQAETFVVAFVKMLIKQIQNVIKYRKVYQNVCDDYKRITDIMWAVLKSMVGMSSREKFRYHCELQTKVQEEIFSRLRTLIPDINEYNQEEFLMPIYTLTKILSAI
ncbi:hypothetical protein [uncultured Duncaniella sp.]|uniref:hypothetical protein n=1 Tax=uncultured Duncaniella sp. TaxID=2768039 RepID=UPI0026244CF2|nr:hypothetical protein [uncultured Duncaniella sp.]